MHNFIGLDRKHENFRKGIFIDPFDEPTYLTFALDFRFEDNISHDEVDELALGNSPLLSKGQNGAMQFLQNRGFNPQADGLATFGSILKYLTYDAPWYFQEIGGISQLYANATDQSKGYKADDVELSISTLEAIDLRIHELAGLYRNAIFDNKFRRERVPDNLRWFTVDVYVAEFRNLRFSLPGMAQPAAQVLGIDTKAIGSIMGGGNILTNVMDQFGYMKFTCRQCEFDFSESVPFNNTIKVGSDNRTSESNSFKIKVGWVDEEVKFGDGSKIFDDAAKTDIRNPWGGRYIGTAAQNIGSFLTGLPVIGDDIANAGQKAMDALGQIGGFVNPALGSAAQFFNPEVKNIRDVYNIGYASNNDTVPNKKAPPTGNVY